MAGKEDGETETIILTSAKSILFAQKPQIEVCWNEKNNRFQIGTEIWKCKDSSNEVLKQILAEK